MYGNVKRADFSADNALNVLFGQVGQGDIVAHYEGQAPVVVFYIQAAPKVGGELIHKAEHAFVLAAPDFEQIILKAQA